LELSRHVLQQFSQSIRNEKLLLEALEDLVKICRALPIFIPEAAAFLLELSPAQQGTVGKPTNGKVSAAALQIFEEISALSLKNM
jgi:hypothetical protein